LPRRIRRLAAAYRAEFREWTAGGKIRHASFRGL
jgi:hypothetical protein